ncbi:MAG: rRNA maturation RNase YbeY [Patescibacteria group bacterium]
MKLIIEINNKAKCPLSKKYFKKVILKSIGLNKFKLLSISIAIVSEREIKRINKIYRKKDKATDILSFPDYLKNKTGEFSCELIICYPYIKKSAREDKVSIEKEMAYVVSHGILHCLGLEHSKKMYEIQDKVCNSLRIANLY